MAIDPVDQFQIGDEVVVLKFGIITRVTGYVWWQRIDGSAELKAYKLDCGLDVKKEAIAWYDPPRPPNLMELLQRFNEQATGDCRPSSE